MRDALTIITGCTPRGAPLTGRGYAKRWLAGAAQPVLFPKWHRHREVMVDDIADLSDLLMGLEDQRESCVIRGRAKPGAGEIVRRAGEAFEDTPRRWACFDFDGLPGDLTAEQVVLRHLPACFRGVSFHWQYSGSQGFKPGTRLHVWFWLQQALDCEGWLLWLASYGRTSSGYRLPIDPAVFRPVQPHITAGPELIATSDPVSVRSGFHHGDLAEVELERGPLDPGEVLHRACAARGDRPPPTPEAWRARQRGVIGEFNLRFSVRAILERNGYQPVGDRYLHPLSESGLPDTLVNNATHAFCYSPNNPLYLKGIDRATGEMRTRNLDAFDCFRVLECDESEALAVRRAAVILGTEGRADAA